MQTSTVRSIRTAIQAAIGVAAALPAIVAASGIPESLPWVAGALAIAAGVSRVMALPVVEQLLDRIGIGLTEDGRP
ncbi:hypothetical protein ACFVWY_33725 [Streptomyces sp. NPDC058195]|uniref:hypothetical protein n=1 Tax=Streptomyces sp. NPDC058195 TaxID=3346375 RepID=UPI0036EC81AC